jgi:hypothetical protein
MLLNIRYPPLVVFVFGSYIFCWLMKCFVYFAGKVCHHFKSPGKLMSFYVSVMVQMSLKCVLANRNACKVRQQDTPVSY